MNTPQLLIFLTAKSHLNWKYEDMMQPIHTSNNPMSQVAVLLLTQGQDYKIDQT